MMHHPNIHHQNMSGHPGSQHIQSHQGVPAHHQLTQHQMHRDQPRLNMNQSMQANSMQLGQPPLGAMQGQMVHHSQPGPPPHQPHQPPPQMRHHRAPPMQHSQHMPAMRRTIICGTTPQMLQQRPPQPTQHPTQIHLNLRPIQQTSSTNIVLQPQVMPQNHQQPVSVNPDARPSPISSTVEAFTPQSGSVSNAAEVDTENSTLTNGNASGVLEDKPNSPIDDDDCLSSGMANSKEKTPMCLVNELARFNKIKHQYRLTRETGPAHKKRFTVALRLGDGEGAEEYVAEGGSIKRAQHAAAAEALKKTHLVRPPPKPLAWRRNTRLGVQGAIMPTVELNALAMKLCQPAIYHAEPPIPLAGRTVAYRCPQRPLQPHFPSQGFPFRGYWPAYRMRGATDATTALLHRVRLKVGTREWQGEGATSQAARHAAAAAALRDLRNATPPISECGETTMAAAVIVEEGSSPVTTEEDELDNADLKSPVSLVHELALKRNLPVTFKVKNERGPPHMKVFVTTCTVGELETEGEGNGKRISKRRAAESMVAKMKTTLTPIPQERKNAIKAAAQRNAKRKQQQPKKRARNLIKEGIEGAGAVSSTSAASDSNLAPNPISVLAVKQASRRARSPQYKLVEERGAARRRCFVVECTAPGGPSAIGQGPNKKAAKRNAAENVLVAMGVNLNKPDSALSTQTQNQEVNDLTETTITSTDTKPSESTKNGRKVTFSVEMSRSPTNHTEIGSPCGRQLVPGLLLMQEHHNTSHFNSNSKLGGVNVQATATIAKELLRACTSPTPETHAKQQSGHNCLSLSPVPNNSNSSPVVSSTTHLGGSPIQPQITSNVVNTSPVATQHIIRPKDQLLYLAQLLGFQVQFSDFPKGNHGEYLSLVSLSTEPPVMCHGGGATTERSHDQSARAALECLSRMGLDNVAPEVPTCSVDGDGLPIGAGTGGTKSGLLANGLNK